MLAQVRLRSYLSVGALLACALLLVACAANGMQPLVAPSATGQPSADGAARPPEGATPTGSGSAVQSWLTHRDAQWGYAFRYPADAYLEAGTNRDGVHSVRLQFDLPGAGYQGMLLRIEPNPQRQGIEQALAHLYAAAAGEATPAELLAQFEEIRVGDRPAVRTTSTGGDFVVAIPYGDYIYIAAPVHGPAAAAVTSDALALYYQVLDSLIFSGVLR